MNVGIGASVTCSEALFPGFKLSNFDVIMSKRLLEKFDAFIPVSHRFFGDSGITGGFLLLLNKFFEKKKEVSGLDGLVSSLLFFIGGEGERFLSYDDDGILKNSNCE